MYLMIESNTYLRKLHFGKHCSHRFKQNKRSSIELIQFWEKTLG